MIFNKITTLITILGLLVGSYAFADDIKTNIDKSVENYLTNIHEQNIENNSTVKDNIPRLSHQNLINKT